MSKKTKERWEVTIEPDPEYTFPEGQKPIKCDSRPEAEDVVRLLINIGGPFHVIARRFEGNKETCKAVYFFAHLGSSFKKKEETKQ